MVVIAADGVVVSVGDGGAGTLKAIRTAGRPIVFTTSGSLSPGAWQGITFGAGSVGSRLEHEVVEGGGYGVEAGGAPQIADSAVTGTTGGDGTGIHVSSGSAVRIERTTASGNSGPGIVNEESRSLLRFVTLAGNGAEGLRSTSGELALRDGAVTGRPVPMSNADNTQLRVVDARQQVTVAPRPVPSKRLASDPSGARMRRVHRAIAGSSRPSRKLEVPDGNALVDDSTDVTANAGVGGAPSQGSDSTRPSRPTGPSALARGLVTSCRSRGARAVRASSPFSSRRERGTSRLPGSSSTAASFPSRRGGSGASRPRSSRRVVTRCGFP